MAVNRIVVFLCLVCLFEVRGQFDPSLFWSYYNKASVERSHVISDGYQRDNPDQWVGNNIVEQKIDYDERKQDDFDSDILVLGSLSRISHGPRRRREAGFKVYDYPGSAENIRQEQEQILKFRQFLKNWPTKKKGERVIQTRSGTNYDELYDKHYQKFYKEQTKETKTFPAPHCRHACEGGDPSVPCCSSFRDLYSLGPPVQPTLLENWVTGVFELAANSPVTFTVIKTLVIFGLIGAAVLLWGSLGHTLGVINLPQARLFGPANAFGDEDRIMLEVLDGNWLTTLEEHVKNNSKFSGLTHFYCCVSSEDPKSKSKLECFPHKKKTFFQEPNFECKSALKYDISLNLKPSQS